MKKILFTFLFILLLFTLSSCSDTKEPIDKIDSYEIWVSKRDDATLDFRVRIVWNVIYSSSDDPLTWVKIGVPNANVDEVKGLTNNIKKARYYDDGGDYIRIDFKEKYYTDDVITFSYSFHQSYIFSRDRDYIHFEFIPGWFDSIAVESIKVYWEKEDVYSVNTSNESDNYYLWEASLNPGEALDTIMVNYTIDTFPNIDFNKSVNSMSPREKIIVFVAIAIVVAVIILFAVVARLLRNDYYEYRGFYPYHRHFPFYHYGKNRKGDTIRPPKSRVSGGSGSSGGHSCACACACACAGGGRAGCARKDFYHPNLEYERFMKIIEEREE